MIHWQNSLAAGLTGRRCQRDNKRKANDVDWTQLLWWKWRKENCSVLMSDSWRTPNRCLQVSDRLNLYVLSLSVFSRESAGKTQTKREGDVVKPTSVAWLTQALAHGHAVLLWVEIVAVAGAAPVYEAHALPLAHVEVPAGHGGTAGAGLSLQGAHRCQGTAC